MNHFLVCAIFVYFVACNFSFGSRGDHTLVIIWNKFTLIFNLVVVIESHWWPDSARFGMQEVEEQILD